SFNRDSVVEHFLETTTGDIDVQHKSLFADIGLSPKRQELFANEWIQLIHKRFRELQNRNQFAHIHEILFTILSRQSRCQLQLDKRRQVDVLDAIFFLDNVLGRGKCHGLWLAVTWKAA